MESKNQQIKCPKCGTEIDVNDILYHQLKDEINIEYQNKLTENEEELKIKLAELDKQRKNIEQEKEALSEKIEEGIRSQLNVEKNKIEKKLREQIESETSEELKSYKDQLEQKTLETKELNKLKAEHARILREKEELKDKIEAEAESRFSQKLSEEKQRIAADAEGKNQLKLNERDHLISQLTEQLKDAQRKIEQKSMQAQGEVQELAIEEWLKSNFPFDDISEIKKGVKGGDCIQIVNTSTSKNCGSIYYESKRTKDFQKTWIEKFKSDMLEKGADVGVIVTEAFPKDLERMGQVEGIWICTLSEFKGLCFVLRESIIKVHNALKTQDNKGDKMHMLYDYLISNEFRMQMEAIVDGFVQMQTDLNGEKRAMEGIWKKREKQINKVLLNTNYMYSSIKGIAGKEIADIKVLELGGASIEE